MRILYKLVLEFGVVAFDVFGDLVICLEQQVIGIELFVFNNLSQVFLTVNANVADRARVEKA
jgi:hypothetical protein